MKVALEKVKRFLLRTRKKIEARLACRGASEPMLREGSAWPPRHAHAKLIVCAWDPVSGFRTCSGFVTAWFQARPRRRLRR